MQTFEAKVDSQMTESILGEELYNEIKEFFFHFITVNCVYKVLLTRRSYVLFKIFYDILLHDERIKLVPFGNFFNTHSLNEIPDSVEDILVCDDIIVNGRTICYVKEKLKKKSAANIAIWCLRCSSEAAFLDEIRPLLRHVIYVQAYEWERLSDLLTDVTVMANLGYVSFVNSYRLPMSVQNHLENGSINFTKKSIATKSLKNEGRYHINCFFAKPELDINKVLKEFCIKPIFRFYLSHSHVLAIPFVVLPPVKKNEMYDYSVALMKSLGIGIPTYFSDHEDVEHCILLYKWITNRLSKTIMSEYLIKFLSDVQEVPTYFDCKESFQFNLEKVIIGKKSGYVYKLTAPRNIEMETCASFFENACQWESGQIVEQNFDNLINNYLAKMRKEDDLLAENGLNRRIGIRYIDIDEVVAKKSHSENFNSLAHIIYQCDTGKLSYVVDSYEVDGITYISGFFKHGEQALRALFSAYSDVYAPLSRFFDVTYETRKAKIMEFARYFNGKYDCPRIVEFVDKICFDTFFADITTISPKSLGNDMIFPDAERVIKDYIENEYEP